MKRMFALRLHSHDSNLSDLSLSMAGQLLATSIKREQLPKNRQHVVSLCKRGNKKVRQYQSLFVENLN